MKKFNLLIVFILSIPKTLYFNFRCLEFKDAIRLPIIVSYNTRLKSIKGKVRFENRIRFAQVFIGFGNVGIFDQRRRRTILEIEGQLIFRGKAFIGHGSSICVKGIFIMGNNFKITAESKIICLKKIIFGDDCLISWDCLFMDTDFHQVYDFSNKKINDDREIIIGKNVWIGCRSLVLKGSMINDNSIISAQSKVNRKFNETNVIISGDPAEIVKKNINWKR